MKRLSGLLVVLCMFQAATTWAGPFTADNGTVTDSQTGLVWQQQDDATGRTWNDAITYCEGLSLGGYSDWRLPNIKELESITSDTGPAIIDPIFTGALASSYWSSTTGAHDPGSAWSVNFYFGYVNYADKTVAYYVRCVRFGQAVPASNSFALSLVRSGTGSGIILSKPEGIKCGDDCTETYKEGSSVTLMALPDVGSTFTGWSGACSGTGPCTVTLSADMTIGATFGADTPRPANTLLRMSLSSRSILKSGSITISGRLTRLPDFGNDMTGLDITLTITAPDSTKTSQSARTSGSDGSYSFPSVAVFTQTGTYRIKASFAGTGSLAPSETSTQTLEVLNLPGYAVIIEGSVPSGEGLPSHNKTTNRIYQSLKDRGFTDDNIQYFNTQNTQTGVDGLPTKNDIQSAIESWAKTRMNAQPSPFYIILVDHGDTGTFYIGSETITGQDLSLWLDSLEGGLSALAKAEKRIVIIGSCYSGSYIPVLSKEGRVIITSARSDEKSYKGPMEDDTIRSGEFFLDELFDQLKRGYTIKKAFENAATETMTYTGSGSGRLYDKARQHPLLDDNADKRGSTILTDTGDGALVNSLYLGYGKTYDPTAQDNPAAITAVTNTIFLDTVTTSASLWAKANQDSLASSVWAEIKSPEQIHTQSTIQLDPNLPKQAFSLNTATGRWEGTYNAFSTAGTHEVYYFVRDKNTSKTTSMKRSLVYKNREGNTPPSAFNLINPAEGSTQNTVLVFNWQDSTDADGLTYTLMLSKSADFSTIDYIKEEIPDSTAVVGVEDNLSDVTIWYWKVVAVDSYGAKTESSQVRSFLAINNNTNGLPGIVNGNVTDALTGYSIVQAMVSSDKGASFHSLNNGYFLVEVPSGPVTLTAEAGGYGRQEISSFAGPGEVLEMNINLTPQNPCAAGLISDLELRMPVININNDLIWATIKYDPSRPEKIVFGVTGYGAVTDAGDYSACTPSTVTTDLRLIIPDINFGTMRLKAEMKFYEMDGSRILIEVTGYEILN